MLNSRCYQSRNPLVRDNPLRSLPLYRAPGALAPVTELDVAKWKLDHPLHPRREVSTIYPAGPSNLD